MTVEKEKRQKVDLDSILIEEIGQFGKFQLRTCLLIVILTFFVAFGTNEYLFTTARINSRCVIPECDDAELEWSPYWLPNAVPVNEGSVDNCQRFGNTSLARIVESTTCPSTLFDRDTLEPCEAYVYENTFSIVYEFDLACKEWQRSMVGTVRVIGIFIALPIVGYIADRWGRRVAITITAFNTAWLGVVRYWTDSYIGFTISEFAESLFGAGCFTSAYVLMLELVGPKYRVIAGASANTFFSTGSALMGLIAWAVPYWRHLTLVLYIPQLLLISYYWLLPESIRWFTSKGRHEEAEALLRKVANVNGKELSDESLKALRQNAEDARKRALEQKNVDKEWLIVTVFKHKRVLLRCIVAPVWWITSTLIYYGLSVNAVNMSGNRYVNFMAVFLVEIPGFWLSVILMRLIGRKIVLTAAFWLCAAFQIAYIFVPQDWYALSLTVYLLAKFSIAMEVSSVHVYTAELYPTERRQSLFNFTSMIGRIGSMVAPLTPAFGAQWFEELPFVLFASFGILSGALVFLTPETLGTKLPDTFEQAEALGREDKSTAM